MASINTSPLKVHVTRGNSLESSHLVHAIIMDKDGLIIEGWGDMERPISPRSTLKPLQTIAFVESGAVEGAPSLGLRPRLVCGRCEATSATPEILSKPSPRRFRD